MWTHNFSNLYPVERSRSNSLATPRRISWDVSESSGISESALEPSNSNIQVRKCSFGPARLSVVDQWDPSGSMAKPRPSIATEWNVSRASDNLAKRIRLEGFRQFVEAKAVLAKVLWITLFSLAVVTLVYEICKAVRDYKNSPITTTYQIKTPEALEFPDIYICYATALNKTYLRTHLDALQGAKSVYESVVTVKKRKKRNSMNTGDFDRPHEFEHFLSDEEYSQTLADVNSVLYNSILLNDKLNDVEVESDEFHRSKRKGNQSKIDHSHHKTANKAFTVDAYRFLLEAGFSVKDTFLSCSFGGKKLDCNDVIKPILDPNYFLCHVVDLPDEMKQRAPGRGLRLLINSHVSLYPTENETSPSRYSGIFVSVSKNYDPTNWLKTVVRSGTINKIDIFGKRIKLLNLRSGPLIQPCVEDGRELYRIFNASYSRTACQMDCMLDAFYQHCQCILLVDKQLVRQDVLDSSTFCGFNKSSSCLIPKVTKSKEALKVIDECRKVCYTPCDDWRYSMRSSSAPLHSSQNHQWTADQSVLLSDLIDLRVGFGRIAYDELTQSPSKTLSQLISDFGGHVNLWLSVSMLSLIETGIMVIAFCVLTLYSKITGGWNVW